MKLSLAMIVKDEAPVIGNLLRQASRFCNELIVVDTGSTDDTIKIAQAECASVYTFDWCDDFSAARNFAFDKATSDWIIWLDADDVVDDFTVDAINTLFDTDPLPMDVLEKDGVFMPYNLCFDSKGNCTFSVPRERIIRNKPELRWQGAIHESIYVPENKRMHMFGASIKHMPVSKPPDTRNLSILKKLYDKGDREARTLFYYGNELYEHGNYIEAYNIYTTVLEKGLQTWERYHVLRRLARMADGNRRFDTARYWYTAAINLCPLRAEAYCELGLLYYKQDKFLEAIPWYTAASAIDTVPDDASFVYQPAYTYEPWDYLAVCYCATGNFRKATDCSIQALMKGHPDVDRILSNIGLSTQKEMFEVVK